jgi:DNA-binding CsgD family transcriptional regulator
LTVDTGLRRRSRDIGLRAPLVERESELATIGQSLAAAREGTGRVVLIEAPAGKGKSRLLTIAGDMARENDMQVLGAHAAELERDFPFSVAIQLFTPRWSAADAADRAALLAGPARHAAGLLSGELAPTPAAGEDDAYAITHGLFWMCMNLVLPADGDDDPVPLAILVDDAHWADRPSLRFLTYLAARIEELPIALLIASRSGEATADRQAHAALRRAAGAAALAPGSLSPDGVAAVVRSVFGATDPAFCAACRRVTSGNPFLLIQLLDQVRREGLHPSAATAARLGDLAPASVLQAVLERLESLPADARAVARAISILGPTGSLPLVGELAGLGEARVSAAADALAAVHLFHPGSPLSFVHPLVAQSVAASLSPLDRGRLHRRAAQRLRAHGASEEQVAVHLLASPGGEDPDAVDVLRIAARHALASGAAPTAVKLLERALDERPGPEHAELLAELAQAESAAGLPSAHRRLEHALTVAEDTGLRARLAFTQARVAYGEGRYRDAAQVLDDALAEVGDNDRAAEALAAAYVAAAFFVPELSARAQQRAAGLLAGIDAQPSPAQLDVLAHMAIHGGLRGVERAEVAPMAARAWADGALLTAESLDGLSWPLVAGALLYAGDVEGSLVVCDAALAAAREQDSPALFAAASYCRAWALYEQGQIVQSIADARAGLDAQPDGWRAYMRTAYGAIALCHLHRGELEAAETALSIIEHPGVRERIHVPSLLEARAHLRLAQHRPREALADAVKAGELLEATLGIESPGAVAWRSTAALAQLALGDTGAARELAASELDEALRIDIPRLIIRNVRILGLAERGTAGLDLLAEAVVRGGKYPPRLEQIHALLDYGAALRRHNKRAAAREPLRRALELAHRGGATALAQQAQTELAASGGRPRRIMLSGVESLTPSERRVAEMASRGLTTRQVAEALFVTPKTVEFHLRHVYRKLEISSRDQLATALEPDEA